ncbi:dolichol kinase, partial [Halobacterium sp. CBA1126]
MSELDRRLVHASGALLPGAFLAGVVPWPAVQWLLVAGSAVAAALEALRLSGYVSWRIFDRLTREYEQDNPAGYALYVFSWTATVWLFDPPIAVPALLMLALADPASGLLSQSSGLETKQGWVLLATFGICMAIASLLDVPPLAAAAGALA